MVGQGPVGAALSRVSVSGMHGRAAIQKRPGTVDVIVNVIAFQMAWLVLVLGAANGLPFVGLVMALGTITLHLLRSPRAVPEAKLLLAAVTVGTVIETAILATGSVSYAAPALVSWLPPLWLVMLWPAFATLLNVTFRRFRSWVVAAVVFGFAFAPLAYYAGAKLGAMTMPDPFLRSLSIIGLAWAVALPLLVIIARRWDGWRYA